MINRKRLDRHGTALTILFLAASLTGCAFRGSHGSRPTVLKDDTSVQKAESKPRVFLIDPDSIVSIKARVADGDESLEPAIRKLRADADKALRVGPFSVVDKPMVPPSGDKRDYMSMGPYWWPNPDTPDGLPYVRHDGRRNPEVEKFDRQPMSRMTSAVKTLALAYYLTDHEPYADHAALLLRAWFLDEETRMNPHLQYGQAIPGIVEGRGIGIIDTKDKISLIDSLGLLAGSKAWTRSGQEGMVDWFDRYLEWLITSEHGKDEDETLNNHATWYDVQVAGMALFVGRDQLAREVLERVKTRRIPTQIEPDGSQPHELERTLSLSYVSMNLIGMFDLAVLAERVDIDLWTFETEDGRDIRRAVEWLYPYAAGEKEWQHEQISETPTSRLAIVFRRAAIAYEQEKYEAVLSELSDIDSSNRIHLLYPKPVFPTAAD